MKIIIFFSLFIAKASLGCENFNGSYQATDSTQAIITFTEQDCYHLTINTMIPANQKIGTKEINIGSPLVFGTIITKSGNIGRTYWKGENLIVDNDMTPEIGERLVIKMFLKDGDLMMTTQMIKNGQSVGMLEERFIRVRLNLF